MLSTALGLYMTIYHVSPLLIILSLPVLNPDMYAGCEISRNGAHQPAQADSKG